MLEQVGINEKEVVLKAKEIKNLRKQLMKNINKALVVSPFTMYGGFKDFSELGELGLNNKITDYSQFERVFTGKSSVIAIWDNSTSIKNVGGELHKEFNVGSYYVGISFETQLSSSADEFSDTDFVSLHDTEQITAVFPDKDFNEEDLYKIFVIPQETNRWLRISSITRIKDPNNEVVFTEVQFTSVNDLIEQTGISLYSHIQRSAVGENYAWPVVNDKGVQHQVLGGEGVNEFQIEILGNAAIAGIGFVGRDADDVKINEPKWLLTEKLLQPIESQVKKISAAENNYTLLRDAKYSLQTYYTDWKQEMAQGYDLTIRKQYEGMFHFDRVKTDLHASEQDKNIWNDDITFADSNNIEIDGANSPYVRGALNLPSLKVPNLLNSNILAYNWLTQLPQEIEQSVAWRSTNIPVIGKMLDKVVVGIPFGIRNTKTLIKARGINYLASTPQTNYFTKAVFNDKNGRGLIPMEAFNNNDDNPIASIVGSKTTSMVFRGKLSDAFGGKTTETLGKSTHKYSGEDMDATNKYFIIDKQIVQMVGKADYIITFFKDGVRKWSSRYQSTAKWTDNPRDWLNFVSFSPWNEFAADQTGLNWNQIDELPIPGGSTGSYAPRLIQSEEHKVWHRDILGHPNYVSEYSKTFFIPTSIASKYSTISIDGIDGDIDITPATINTDTTLPPIDIPKLNGIADGFTTSIFYKKHNMEFIKDATGITIKIKFTEPDSYYLIEHGSIFLYTVKDKYNNLTLFNK